MSAYAVVMVFLLTNAVVQTAANAPSGLLFLSVT